MEHKRRCCVQLNGPLERLLLRNRGGARQHKCVWLGPRREDPRSLARSDFALCHAALENCKEASYVHVWQVNGNKPLTLATNLLMLLLVTPCSGSFGAEVEATIVGPAAAATQRNSRGAKAREAMRCMLSSSFKNIEKREIKNNENTDIPSENL